MSTDLYSHVNAIKKRVRVLFALVVPYCVSSVRLTYDALSVNITTIVSIIIIFVLKLATITRKVLLFCVWETTIFNSG